LTARSALDTIQERDSDRTRGDRSNQLTAKNAGHGRRMGFTVRDDRYVFVGVDTNGVGYRGGQADPSS
jgi:hypothetical protein